MDKELINKINLVIDNYNIYIFISIILILLFIFLKRKTSNKDYSYFINLIKKDFKLALAQLEKLDEITIKEDLLLYGHENLQQEDYITIKNFLIDDDLLKSLLVEISTGENSQKRKAGLTLIKIGTPQAIDYVNCLLYDQNQEVTDLIIKNLAKIEDPKIINTLVNYLNTCDNLETLESLKEAFLKIGERNISVLLNLLNSNTNEHKLWGIKLLSVFNDKQVIEPFIKLLYKNNNPSIKIAAAQGLSQFRYAKILRVFLDKLNDEDYKFRAELLNLIASYKNSEVAPYIAKMLEDDNLVVRENACKALINLGDDGIKEIMLAIENKEMPKDVKESLNNINATTLIKLAKEIYASSNISDDILSDILA